MDRIYTSVSAAARLLDVPEKTIRNWMDSGYLQPERRPVSNYRRIPSTEVQRLIDERSARQR